MARDDRERKPKSQTDAVQNRGRQGLRRIDTPQGSIRQEEPSNGGQVDLSNLQRTRAPSLEQFQRRQDRDQKVEQRGLRREAFGRSTGSAGRPGSAVDQLRSSLTGGMSRMDRLNRRDGMTEEQRQGQANLFAGAAQTDAEQLREARGLRQTQDLGDRELAFRERDSVRDFQASLADTNARTQQQQAEAQREFQQESIDRGFSVAQGVVAEANPELAESPGFRGQYDSFVSETNKDQLQGAAPFNLRGEDIGGLFAIGSQLPELDAGLWSRTPDRPVSAGAVLDLINRAAQNPGASEIDTGRGKIAVSKLQGLAGGLFDQYVSRARTGFENQVAENVLRGEKLDEKQQGFVEGELSYFKEQEKQRFVRELPSVSPSRERTGRGGLETNASLTPEEKGRLQEIGVSNTDEITTAKQAMEAIDSLSTDDFLPVLARRALDRRTQ